MRPRLFAAVLPLLLAACGPRGGPATPAGGAPTPANVPDSTVGPEAVGGRWYGYEGGLRDAESAARTIEGAARYWQPVEARWRADADTGSLVAHFQQRRLRRMAVTWAGGGTTGSGAYTYDEQARLFHYQGEERRRTGRGRAARTERVVVSIALDPRGVTSATRKTVGGRAQPLRPEEVQAIVAREAVVRQAAVEGFRAR